MEMRLVYALANILATKWTNLGDVLSMDWDENDLWLAFDRIAAGTVVPAVRGQRGGGWSGKHRTGRKHQRRSRSARCDLEQRVQTAFQSERTTRGHACEHRSSKSWKR